MSVEQQQAADPVWGAPPAQPPTWSTRATLAAVGIAVVLAAGGGLVIYAATSGSHSSGPAPMSAGRSGWGGPDGIGPPGAGGPGDLPQTLHGEYVVPNDKGGFTIELTQTGTVTKATATSVTVRSDDGYNRAYTLDATTRKPHEPLQTGEQVTVKAIAANGDATATAVSPAH